MYPKVTALFVGNLAATVTPDNLYELFSLHGRVVSTFVSRNKRTKISRGYGFVNFFWADQAADAIKKLNGTQYKGKYLHVMYKESRRSDRHNNNATVILQNIHPDVRDEALYFTFSEYGRLTRCKVVLDENGKSKRLAYVGFEDEKVADYIVQTLNGWNGMGDKVIVTKFKTKKERMKQVEDCFTTIFIKIYYKYISEEQLKEICQEYGKVEQLVMGRKKYDAVVKFSNHQEAKTAVKELDYKNFADFKLRVSRIKSRAQIEEERQKLVLYLTNIGQDVNKTELEVRFPELAKAKQMKVYTRAKESNKNYAFVHFSTSEQANTALEAVNNKKLKDVTIFAKYSNRKNKKITK